MREEKKPEDLEARWHQQQAELVKAIEEAARPKTLNEMLEEYDLEMGRRQEGHGHHERLWLGRVSPHDCYAFWRDCPTTLRVKDKILTIDLPHELRPTLNSLLELPLRVAFGNRSHLP